MTSSVADDQDTERVFGMAANYMVTVRGQSLTSDQRLRLYSLFKQATEGDCGDPKPGLVDLVGRAKWGAWDTLRGTEPRQAMAAYIAAVTDLCPEWADHAAEEPCKVESKVDLDEMKRDLQWEGDDENEDAKGAGIEFGVTVSTMAAGQSDTAAWREDEEIFAAASEGDVSRVERLVAAGTDVDVKDEDGRSPLHFAADRGHPTAILRLLELGASVDARDSDGMTPLAYAVACEHEQEIRLLVEAGANINSVDDEGSTPLSSASHSIRHLLSHANV